MIGFIPWILILKIHQGHHQESTFNGQGFHVRIQRSRVTSGSLVTIATSISTLQLSSSQSGYVSESKSLLKIDFLT